LSEESIFTGALEKAAGAEREQFLEDACGGDFALRRRIDELLALHEGGSGLLDGITAIVDSKWEASLRDPAPSLALGTLVAGRYRLLERIGEGGMGEVYAAEQISPVRRRVALKLVKPGLDSRSVLTRFERERQALAVMDHPNIAKILDGGVTESGRPFFVMEYLKGIPITEYCDQVRMPVPQRLELFRTACQAVQHAHQKGVIHRDLKPSNILVAMYDEKPVVKVIDFGLAKVIDQPISELAHATGHAVLVGTPLYMSPEQAKLNNLDIDTRSDVYALGVILYELLTGSTPIAREEFQRTAWNEAMRLIREVDPPTPSSRVSSNEALPSLAAQRQVEPAKLTRLIRGELDWIVMKSLEKDRERRFDSARALEKDIENYLLGAPLTAGPPSKIYHWKRFAWRNRWTIGTTALVLASLTIGLAVASYGLYYAMRATESERLAKTNEEERRKEADVQRVRAEEREEDAIAAVKRFAKSITENPELKTNPSLESLRKTLLKEPLAYFQALRERLQAHQQSPPRARLQLAEALVELAELTDAIGDKGEAIEAFDEAVAILEPWANEYPGNGFQWKLASVLNARAVAHFQIGKIGQAIEDLQNSIRWLEILLDESPENIDFLKTLAAAKARLGSMHATTGDRTAALIQWEDAKSIFASLVQRTPTSQDEQSEIAENFLNLGMLSTDTLNFDLALSSFEKAIEITEKLAAEEQQSVAYRLALSRAYDQCANLLYKHGKVESSLDLYEKNRVLLERLTHENPTTTEFQASLAECYFSIWTVHFNIGKRTEASEALTQSREILSRLVQDHPMVTNFQRRLANVYSNLGTMHFVEGDFAACVKAYSQCIAMQEKLVRENPTNQSLKTILAHSFQRLGVYHHEVGMYKEAGAYGEKSSQLLMEDSHSDRASNHQLHVFALSKLLMGGSLSRSGDLERGLLAFREAGEVLERLVNRDPSDFHFLSDLAHAYSNQGKNLESLGKLDDALIELFKAQRVSERVLDLTAAQPEYILLKTGIQDSIGSVLRTMSRLDEALETFASAKEFLEHGTREYPGNPRISQNLARVMHNMALVLLDQKEYAMTKAMLQDAIRLQQQALDKNPLNATSREHLINHYSNLGKVAIALGDFELAWESQRQQSKLAMDDARFRQLDEHIEAVWRGESSAESMELIQFAHRSYATGAYAKAVRFWQDAFQRAPELVEDRNSQHAYNAACNAVLATHEMTASNVDTNIASIAKLREQAMQWLSAELDAWTSLLITGAPAESPRVAQTMKHWQTDFDLYLIRDATSLEQLPEGERKAWQELWNRVEELRIMAMDTRSAVTP